jgi:hypothetical protein
MDPDHPELGERSAGVLVNIQKSRGLPFGKKIDKNIIIFCA